MFKFTHKNEKKPVTRFTCLTIVQLLVASLIVTPNYSYAQTINLPAPGAMVSLSAPYQPVLIKGMAFDSQNPLEFNFIVDAGDSTEEVEGIKKETEKLTKYFLAALTVPEEDMWVNLSPYEHDRLVAEDLGRTELGRDLLAQDYLLKQITSSLMYPEGETGSAFWQKIYEKAYQQFGTTDVPIDTFNKVWIMPETMRVYENGNAVYVTEAKLKVMLEQDYKALENNVLARATDADATMAHTKEASTLSSEVVRDIIIPELEREVNEGENFAPLRQIMNSLVLAKWYKDALRETILGQVYVDSNKVAGVESDDPQMAKEKIYQQYVEAYKKGVFNYIKEDYDMLSQEVLPRQYFSGGFTDGAMVVSTAGKLAEVVFNAGRIFSAYVLAIIPDNIKRWTAIAGVSALATFGADGLKADEPVRFTGYTPTTLTAESMADQMNATQSALIDGVTVAGDTLKVDFAEYKGVKQSLQGSKVRGDRRRADTPQYEQYKRSRAAVENAINEGQLTVENGVLSFTGNWNAVSDAITSYEGQQNGKSVKKDKKDRDGFVKRSGKWVRERAVNNTTGVWNGIKWVAWDGTLSKVFTKSDKKAPSTKEGKRTTPSTVDKAPEKSDKVDASKDGGKPGTVVSRTLASTGLQSGDQGEPGTVVSRMLGGDKGDTDKAEGDKGEVDKDKVDASKDGGKPGTVVSRTLASTGLQSGDQGEPGTVVSRMLDGDKDEKEDKKDKEDKEEKEEATTELPAVVKQAKADLDTAEKAWETAQKQHYSTIEHIWRRGPGLSDVLYYEAQEDYYQELVDYIKAGLAAEVDDKAFTKRKLSRAERNLADAIKRLADARQQAAKDTAKNSDVKKVEKVVQDVVTTDGQIGAITGVELEALLSRIEGLQDRHANGEIRLTDAQVAGLKQRFALLYSDKEVFNRIRLDIAEAEGYLGAIERGLASTPGEVDVPSGADAEAEAKAKAAAELAKNITEATTLLDGYIRDLTLPENLRNQAQDMLNKLSVNQNQGTLDEANTFIEKIKVALKKIEDEKQKAKAELKRNIDSAKAQLDAHKGNDKLPQALRTKAEAMVNALGAATAGQSDLDSANRLINQIKAELKKITDAEAEAQKQAQLKQRELIARYVLDRYVENKQVSGDLRVKVLAQVTVLEADGVDENQIKNAEDLIDEVKEKLEEITSGRGAMPQGVILDFGEDGNAYNGKSAAEVIDNSGEEFVHAVVAESPEAAHRYLTEERPTTMEINGGVYTLVSNDGVRQYRLELQDFNVSTNGVSGSVTNRVFRLVQVNTNVPPLDGLNFGTFTNRVPVNVSPPKDGEVEEGFWSSLTTAQKWGLGSIVGALLGALVWKLTGTGGNGYKDKDKLGTVEDQTKLYKAVQSLYAEGGNPLVSNMGALEADIDGDGEYDTTEVERNLEELIAELEGSSEGTFGAEGLAELKQELADLQKIRDDAEAAKAVPVADATDAEPAAEATDAEAKEEAPAAEAAASTDTKEEAPVEPTKKDGAMTAEKDEKNNEKVPEEAAVEKDTDEAAPSADADVDAEAEAAPAAAGAAQTDDKEGAKEEKVEEKEEQVDPKKQAVKDVLARIKETLKKMQEAAEKISPDVVEDIEYPIEDVDMETFRVVSDTVSVTFNGERINYRSFLAWFLKKSMLVDNTLESEKNGISVVVGQGGKVATMHFNKKLSADGDDFMPLGVKREIQDGKTIFSFSRGSLKDVVDEIAALTSDMVTVSELVEGLKGLDNQEGKASDRTDAPEIAQAKGVIAAIKEDVVMLGAVIGEKYTEGEFAAEMLDRINAVKDHIEATENADVTVADLAEAMEELGEEWQDINDHLVYHAKENQSDAEKALAQELLLNARSLVTVAVAEEALAESASEVVKRLNDAIQAGERLIGEALDINVAALSEFEVGLLASSVFVEIETRGGDKVQKAQDGRKGVDVTSIAKTIEHDITNRVLLILTKAGHQDRDLTAEIVKRLDVVDVNTEKKLYNVALKPSTEPAGQEGGSDKAKKDSAMVSSDAQTLRDAIVALGNTPSHELSDKSRLEVEEITTLDVEDAWALAAVVVKRLGVGADQVSDRRGQTVYTFYETADGLVDLVGGVLYDAGYPFNSFKELNELISDRIHHAENDGGYEVALESRQGEVVDLSTIFDEDTEVNLAAEANLGRWKDLDRGFLEDDVGPRDEAFVSTQDRTGGIDARVMDVQSEGLKIMLEFDQAQITQLNNGDFNGLMPVFMNFQRITTPFPILGVAPRKEEYQEFASADELS